MVQFYQDGFDLSERRWTYSGLDDAGGSRAQDVPAEVDVLIVGTGPAGLLLAAQLAGFPRIRTLTVEKRATRLQLGQADGLQCRSLETFEAFRFSERVLREAYWVNETTFWQDGRRTGRTKDTDGALSEFPHVILNQARVHDFFLDEMWKRGGARPVYCKRLVALERVEHGMLARVEDVDAATDRAKRTLRVKARFVVGADGAHSTTRKCIGLALQGDSANTAWGVMDVLADTDFPDMRFKSALKSTAAGTAILIPREGGFLVRLYIELGATTSASSQWGLGNLIAKAQKIFAPFRLDVRECAWWSVYEIGQRMTRRFDDDERDPRAFIVGDACHTHSPKAGQGMNVSMADAWNLGWKLAHVCSGLAPPGLLKTYTAERHGIAAELIRFDREWNAVLSAARSDKSIQEAYERAARYTEGLATEYAPSALTLSAAQCSPHLAEGYALGRRFPSDEVLRAFDARVVHLAHTISAAAQWHVFVFAGAGGLGAASPARSLCAWLERDRRSPLQLFRDCQEAVDVKAVLRGSHVELKAEDVPCVLVPRRGRLRLRDMEKVFVHRWEGGTPMRSVYDSRGVDEGGCVVLVRPDGYVSAVFGLEETEGVAAFFEGVAALGR